MKKYMTSGPPATQCPWHVWVWEEGVRVVCVTVRGKRDWGGKQLGLNLLAH